MSNFKALGIIGEKDGKMVYIPIEEVHNVDLGGLTEKVDEEAEGISTIMSPEEVDKIANREFEENLSNRLKKHKK